jgi:8-oxo-dGTP pyrophosphatase MutT (NUDIX family)
MNKIDFQQCIDFLGERFQKPLPGPEAHKKLSPPHRHIPDIATLKNHRNSSVMLLVQNKNNIPHLIFIERADDGHVHSGQIALPGGKVEMHDKDLLATALRETKEEIGIHENKVQLLGKLSPLYIPPSNFLVNPFTGFVADEIIFSPDKKEVKQILEIPLSDFFKDDVVNFAAEHKTHRGIVKAPCYELHGVKIWGATCMIVTEFLSLFE